MIASVAERQHGVVARQQLVELGLGRRAIGNRVSQGRLHAVHRGVYAVGHRAITVRGRWMAAVLAVGAGAVLSHRSAASLWAVLRSAPGAVEVTRARRCRPRPGLELHRASLATDEVTIRDGIPVTTVPRTLLDLAEVLGRTRLERAIEQAEALRLVDSLSLPDLLARHPGRRGTATLRAVLTAAQASSGATRSELEDRFLDLLDRHGLPAPRVNASIEVREGWMECDCVWRSRGIVVELDGRATHGTAAAFERDRARDRALQADGWRVVRVTWRQLEAEGERVASDLRDLLLTRRPGAPWEGC